MSKDGKQGKPSVSREEMRSLLSSMWSVWKADFYRGMRPEIRDEVNPEYMPKMEAISQAILALIDDDTRCNNRPQSAG